jgi:hypothetical protein
MKIPEDKRLIDLTIADLRDFIDSRIRYARKDVTVMDFNQDEAPHTVRGIKGLAEYLQCSKSLVSELKSKGIFKDATFQYGRTILFDKAKALECFSGRFRK